MSQSFPASLEAEMYLLRALMDGSAHDDLKPRHFYHHANRVLYARGLEMLENNQPIDPVTLAAKLDRFGELEFCGGLAYLREISDLTCFDSAAYSAIVIELSAYRQLVGIGEMLIEQASTPENRAAPEIAEQGMERLSQLALQNANPQPVEFRARLTHAVEHIDRLYSAQLAKETSGTPMPIPLLKLFTGSACLVLGATTAVRTALALHVLMSTATGAQTVYFSENQSAQALTLKLIASLARVPFHRLRTGYIAHEHWPKITMAIQKLSDHARNLIIQDKVIAGSLNRWLPDPYQSAALAVFDLLPITEADLLSLVRAQKSAGVITPRIFLTDISNHREPNRGTSHYNIDDLPVRSDDFDKIVLLEYGNQNASGKREIQLTVIKDAYGPGEKLTLYYLEEIPCFDDKHSGP